MDAEQVNIKHIDITNENNYTTDGFCRVMDGDDRRTKGGLFIYI